MVPAARRRTAVSKTPALVLAALTLVCGADEPDLMNQPADMSYVLGRLLALSAQPHGLFSGLLNRHQIAAAGQSDGGARSPPWRPTPHFARLPTGS